MFRISSVFTERFYIPACTPITLSYHLTFILHVKIQVVTFVGFKILVIEIERKVDKKRSSVSLIFYFQDTLVTTHTPVTPNSWRKLSPSHPLPSLNPWCTDLHSPETQKEERRRGEAINNATFPNINIFSSCDPNAKNAKQR